MLLDTIWYSRLGERLACTSRIVFRDARCRDWRYFNRTIIYIQKARKRTYRMLLVAIWLPMQSVGHFSHLNPLIYNSPTPDKPRRGSLQIRANVCMSVHTHMYRSLDHWHYIDAGNPAPQLHYDNHNSSGYLGDVCSNTNGYHSGLLNILWIGM